MEEHRLGETVFTVLEGDEVTDEMVRKPAFPMYFDSLLYAVYQAFDGDADLLGHCYREHPDAGLTTRMRIKEVGTPTKEAWDWERATPEEGIAVLEVFHDRFGGQLLTPDRLRGRYCAYCRMMRVSPLERSS